MQPGDEAHQRVACAMEVFTGFLPALSLLHAAGFMHGDLKPENMMCDMSSGDITIIDFGSVEPFPREGEEAEPSKCGTQFYQDADRILNPDYVAKPEADW